MVRAIEGHDIVLDAVKYVEYCGNSDDTKPTYFGKKSVVVDGEKVEKTIGLATGSVFFEVDTGNVYMFDEVESEWYIVGGGDDDSGAVDDGPAVIA